MIKNTTKKIMSDKKRGNFKSRIEHPFLQAIMNWNTVIMEQTIKNLVSFLMTNNDVKVVEWQ